MKNVRLSAEIEREFWEFEQWVTAAKVLCDKEQIYRAQV